MITSIMTSDEALRKMLRGDGFDFKKDPLACACAEVRETEVARLSGATLHEKSPERQARRNGYRERRFDTRLDSIELLSPKLRKGSYFPGILEPRKRSSRALWAAIQDGVPQGVSTRKVEDLSLALGVENCSDSELSRVCQALDDEMAAFCERYPCPT